MDNRVEPTVSLLNATKNGIGERATNNNTTSLHNDTLRNVTMQSDILRNITKQGNTLQNVSKEVVVSADTIAASNATDDNNVGTNEPETKILESLLRGVISQVFSNFLHSGSQNSKSFEERISTLEGLLGANKGGRSDDKMVTGLMNAFKSGKAIDRVNNVLNILAESKNNTKLTNSSFSRNADVVVDVLKVLKDVLDTGKGNKNLKNYRNRVANLFEKQSSSTEKLTRKLLSDLKLSGTDSSDVVNDALSLVSQIFQSEKSKSKSKLPKKKLQKRKKTQKKHHTVIEGPNSEVELPYNSIKHILTDVDGNSKVISKTSKSKEIHNDDDNIEKITVERVKINKGGKHSKKPSSHKIGALRHVVGESVNREPNIENDIDSFIDVDILTTQPHKDSFTLTVTKNGEKVSERKVDNLQAVKMLQKSIVEPSSDLPIADKKQSINRNQDNIDIEVVADGKEQVKTKTKKRNNATPYKTGGKTKVTKLNLTDGAIPKSVTSDLAKKEDAKKKNMSMLRIITRI